MAQLQELDIANASAKFGLEKELFAEIDYAQVNAFTDRAFGGNPAAVCYLPFERDSTWLQLVAREFNLSETAFVVRRRASSSLAGNGVSAASGAEANESEDAPRKEQSPAGQGFGKQQLLQKNAQGDIQPAKKAVKRQSHRLALGNQFDLRWFTPTVEVDLCGHATLAAAHWLFAAGLVNDDVIVFHTRSGELRARRIADAESLITQVHTGEAAEEKQAGAGAGAGTAPTSRRSQSPKGQGLIELDFPENVVEEVGEKERQQVASALGGIPTSFIGRTTQNDLLVELESEQQVRRFVPDFQSLRSIEARGISITARADDSPELDYVSRFFAPLSGVDEDPVTGSAHCALGPYWAQKMNKFTLQAFQASGRGGRLAVCVERERRRVLLQGYATLVMAGVLLNTVS